MIFREKFHIVQGGSIFMFIKVPEMLETKRTVIRPFIEDDLEGFYRCMSDEIATEYLLFADDQKTFEGTKQLLEMTIDNYDNDEQIYALTVADRLTGEFIGSVGFGPDFGADPGFCGSVQMFWSILPEYWGKGYATEASKRLLEYAFEELGIKKIIAYSHPQNIASKKIALKIGMKEEGTVYFDFIDDPALKFSISSLSSLLIPSSSYDPSV